MNGLMHIKDVCFDLISKEKRKPVFEILDFYFDLAKDLSEFEILGQVALKAEYHQMYMKCAEAAYCMSITSEQKYASRVNLYKAYNACNFPEKALFYIEQNLEYNPFDFDSLMNKAFNLALIGNREESEDIITSLIDKHPDKEEDIRYSLSGKLLREGKTSDGILNFIDTFKPKSVLFEDQLKMKKWTGGIFPGKKIYVNGEGGIGDEIINIRFFKYLEDYGMSPILYSSWNMYRPDIVDIFRRHGYQVLCEHYSIDTSQLWTNMMPLPGYLGLTENQLWFGPYLFSQKQEKNKLSSKKFKIGFKCNGNPYFSQDVYRCIPIEKMLEYFPKSENIEYYYFEKEKTNPNCINLIDKLNSWDDTLDYIDQMDVIVTSCTSLAHAAGALGKRTIVIVPIAEYYIWTSTRTNNTTPWYDEKSYTVLKQKHIRSWDEPLRQMNKIVSEMYEI
jgi:hypothetical protein